ncbi:Undecaprenyl pyrophosphate synthetase [Granulicatella balaenopterae]|uniref:Isoprenyl transferase n=1 Tax=Granulicatella balaenopterae TaxID=137733 RepID=A0A1H9L527_9LACT|nr:isoprenyl transferase [Granulicatella balaenopterae]SER06506.1 Undecaprenyl pyrophosphate synthetase [Granulicatella balaenopterae]
MNLFKQKETNQISIFDKNGAIPNHIAIIMDGNGRWAKKRLMPRIAGHKEGMNTVKKIAIAADEMGVKAVTMYAFSTENWKRPTEEVNFLMKLPADFFNVFMPEIHERNMKIELIGFIDELPESTKRVVLKAVEDTKDHTGMVLTFALNYGSRAEILAATKKIAQQVADGELEIDDINETVMNQSLQTGFLGEMSDPDLLIRTSGEVRLSNFLCWQLAYSEFYFTDIYWPDFSAEELQKAVAGYQKRHRRFGGL